MTLNLNVTDMTHIFCNRLSKQMISLRIHQFDVLWCRHKTIVHPTSIKELSSSTMRKTSSLFKMLITDLPYFYYFYAPPDVIYQKIWSFYLVLANFANVYTPHIWASIFVYLLAILNGNCVSAFGGIFFQLLNHKSYSNEFVISVIYTMGRSLIENLFWMI